MKNDSINNVVLLLQKTEIFHLADTESLKKFLQAIGEIRTYKRGETIFSGEDYKPVLGLLLSGKALVQKGRANINTLQTGELFGAVTLFGDSHFYATEITAQSECKVVFLSKELVKGLMLQNSAIAESYIQYLSHRIYFLTGKIEAFTAGSSEEKLANYLLKNSQGSEVKEVNVHNLSLLARELDIGRASLYRTLDVFTKAGIITRDGKKIRLLNTEELISYSIKFSKEI